MPIPRNKELTSNALKHIRILRLFPEYSEPYESLIEKHFLHFIRMISNIIWWMFSS